MQDFIVTETETALSFDGVGFDATRTYYSTSVTVDGIEYLYYGGLPFSNRLSIGLATSDGGDFVKVSDTDALISNFGSTPFTSLAIYPERVFYDDDSDLWTMYFWGQNKNLATDNGISGIGIATSTDGFSWDLQQTPLLAETGPSQGYSLNAIVQVDGLYVAYVSDSNPFGTVQGISTSTDGINFTPLQPVGYESSERLLTATEYGDGVIALFKTDDNTVFQTAYSEDGITFVIGSTVQLPGTYSPSDLVVEGEQVKVYAGFSVGNVNWSFGNVVTETFDIPISLFDAPDPNPEPIPFEINVFTAMQLAAASYAPVEENRDKDIAPDISDFGNVDDIAARIEQTQIYNSLFVDGGSTLKRLENYEIDGGIQITDSQGFYVRENAAAMLATTEDSLVVTFRGTNDNRSTFFSLGEAIIEKAVPDGKTQITGAYGALNGVSNGKGNGKGRDKISDKVADKAVPDNLKSPDVANWLNLDGHYQLFGDLVTSIEKLIKDNGFGEVYFIGHSMGGGMAQYAMSQFEDGYLGATYEAFVYAPSGLRDTDENQVKVGDDDRILNLRFDKDPIIWSSLGAEQRGDQIILESSGTGGHGTELYLNAAKHLFEAGFVEKVDYVNYIGEELRQISVRGDDVDGATFVRSGIPSDAILGTSGNDDITAARTLYGGVVVAGLEGNDVTDLVDALDTDAFVFRSGDGHDEVRGFQAGIDQLVLRNFDDPSDVKLEALDGGLFGLLSDSLVATWNENSSITFVGLDDADEFSLAVFGELPGMDDIFSSV